MAPIKKNAPGKNNSSKTKNRTEPGETAPQSAEPAIDMSQTNEGGEINIMAEEVIQKQTSVIGDRSTLNQPAAAANHATASINLDQTEDVLQDGGSQPAPTAAPQQPNWTRPEEESFNPEFHELPKEEQEASSAQTADALIDGYANLKLLIPKLVAVSEKKLEKMNKDGEINIYYRIPLSRNSPEQITILDFVKRFNEKIVSPFETSEEFKNNVRPLLISILKDKGLALTPEQLLIYYVGVDLGNAVLNAIKCTAERREMLDYLKELTGGTSTRPFATPITPDAPPQQFHNGNPVAQPQQPAAPVAAEVVKEVIAGAKDNTDKKAA